MQINERHEFASNDAIVTTLFWRTSMAWWMAVGTRDGVSLFFSSLSLLVSSPDKPQLVKIALEPDLSSSFILIESSISG